LAVITRQQLRSWADPQVAGWYVLDVAVAVALSVFAVLLTTGVTHSGFRHGGVGASVGVLAMTAPVAWRRRAPMSAAAVLAAGAVLNGVVFGSMVRCGAALPAVFLVAYALGIQRDQSRWVLGLGLCWINVAAQAIYDPKLGAAVMVYMLPIAGVFYVFGLIARSRTLALDSLQRQSVELRNQREETARLSVAADRSRLSEELDRMLLDRIDHIAVTARAGRDALVVDPAAASEALLAIEREGRDVLGRMRQIVGSLDDAAPSDPQPTLAELPRLLELATTANARLTIDGDARRLPAGLELSGYRIVEHLLSALDDAPSARVDVRLCFEPDTIELHVRGPAANDVDLNLVLAAARERAGLHRGTLDGRTEDGRCHAMARLPLVSGYA
jgi:hypothetical protein